MIPATAVLPLALAAWVFFIDGDGVVLRVHGFQDQALCERVRALIQQDQPSWRVFPCLKEAQ